MNQPWVFFFSIFFIVHISSAKNLINSTCRTLARNDPNIDFKFCTTSLQASPASQRATLWGLGATSITLIRHNVTDTRWHIRQLLKKKKLDSFYRLCLSDCLGLFSDAIPSVKEAMRNYRDRRFDDANVQISSTMDASTTCEDGFKERKGVVSPLSKRNSDVFQLSAMALSVMREIQTGSG